jgi:phosphatidylglycerophosphatase A
LSTGLGVGYIPVAPGTFGTLLAAAIYWFIFPENLVFFIPVTIFTLAVSIPLSKKAEELFNKKDDRKIVIDEIAGFWIAVLFLPKTYEILFTAFILFRFFDVYKPLFIKKSQSLKSGVGVVIDDVLAGIFANIFTHIFYLVQKAV